LPPAFVHLPPAYRSLPEPASAYTPVPGTPLPPPTPEPSALQVLPSHLATLLDSRPAGTMKEQPPYTSLPETASDNTDAYDPPNPEPNALHALSFHLAITLP